MPLRDLFHAPLKNKCHWEGFHSNWANNIVRSLNERLPQRYRAEPEVHLGVQVEVDVATFERETQARPEAGTGDGVATAVWAPPQPTQVLDADLPAQDTFEVRVYDEERGLRLVAAVELVSPRNKDRAESRRAFVAKCAGYLQQGVALVVVDTVTDRHQNLHRELMELLRLKESDPWPEEQHLYAVAYRHTKQEDRWRLEIWNQALSLGAPLPPLPLWLASNLSVPLDLESTYEETFRVLRII